MRVLFVDAPPELLAERRRLGLDRRDELWEGVVHVVPQPETGHQVFGANVIGAASARLRRRGLQITYETAVYQPGHREWSYRVPDLIVTRPALLATSGIEGPPELVLEILSPNDESREKFPFYAALGCREVLLVDRRRHSFELFRLTDGELVPVPPDEAGTVRLEAFEASISVAGVALRVGWADDGEDDIPFDPT